MTTLFPDEGSMRVCEQLEFNLGWVEPLPQYPALSHLHLSDEPTAHLELSEV
jgi:hypothetical protein